MSKRIFVLYILMLNSLIANAAETLNFESGVKQNILVELYTSEGCSSCPPAESYLNGLKNSNELWHKYVPVAFHVDYWDYIGWKDDYASKKFGQRQSRYASLSRAATVYTPAFMVNGSSWRRGIFGGSLPETDSSVGKLGVSVTDSELSANYKATANYNSPLKLNVAVLGMELTSHISRGENEGRTAQHEFVVVGFDAVDSDSSTWKMKLPKLHYANAKQYALAVWVSEGNNPTPIQVVGGLLPDYKNQR